MTDPSSSAYHWHVDHNGKLAMTRDHPEWSPEWQSQLASIFAVFSLLVAVAAFLFVVGPSCSVELDEPGPCPAHRKAV